MRFLRWLRYRPFVYRFARGDGHRPFCALRWALLGGKLLMKPSPGCRDCFAERRAQRA